MNIQSKLDAMVSIVQQITMVYELYIDMLQLLSGKNAYFIYKHFKMQG